MIVGLCGLIGSGKGTVGDILVAKGFKKDSFAAPLKDAAAIIFDWPRKLLEGDTPESRLWRELPDPFWSEKFGYDFSPRQALQWLGTESCRDIFHPDIWALSLVKRNISTSENVVVTDVRFKNEIETIRAQGGLIIQISRGYPEWYNVAKGANSGEPEARKLMSQLYSHVHISEWDWIGSPVDYVIDNNGTLEDLTRDVNNFLLKFISNVL